MIIKRFRAENFRNIEKCDIEFSKGINILYGNNAQGKTNAVEGIYLFSRGKSFRSSEDKELIKFGSEGFRLYIEYQDKNGEGTLEYAMFGKQRQRKKNGYKIDKVKEMIGNFKSVLFYPDDLLLIKAGPEERRSFLNVAISQCYPEYINHYANYKKALENRNCLLKIASKGVYQDNNEIKAWSEYMARYASLIYIMRKEYVEKLEFHSKKIMSEMSCGKEELSLFYKSDIKEKNISLSDAEEEYKKIFTSEIEREKTAGSSLFGVHRDDILIDINGKSARNFSSQGQQRSIVLALKLGEGEVNKDISGEYPVFLFDDVLSELDKKRKKYIFDGIKEKQIIITSCECSEEIFAENKIEVVLGSYN